MILKLNSTGYMVGRVQQALQEEGYPIEVDQKFGPATEKIVIHFQEDNNLVVDGIVGRNTYEALNLLDTDLYETQATRSDFHEITYSVNGEVKVNRKLTIFKRFLSPDEYIRDKGMIRPHSVFLHHTAGWDNPFNTIADWNNDTRGRVGTHFVIGGKSITGSSENDGICLQAIPDYYAGYHLGRTGDPNLNLYSIGIELCSFGILRKVDGKYYAWPAFTSTGELNAYAGNYIVPEDQVCVLDEPYRGSKYYHKYSDAQIRTLKELLKYLNRNFPTLNLCDGIIALLQKEVSETAVFAFYGPAYRGEVHGLWTHGNVRKDKSDVFPQPELIEMLKSLNF